MTCLAALAGVATGLVSGTAVVAQTAPGANAALTPRFFGGTRPLQASELNQTELEVNASAGLFVGVNEFGTDAGLPNLEFAVDDAVALAHAFVAELRVLPPMHATLALGGDPRTTQGRASLAALKSLGVTLASAERQGVLAEIVRLGNRATDPAA